MANFHQVFQNEPICKHATAYCEYDGDIEVVCGKCQHGKLFCYKCSDYEPKEQEDDMNNNTSAKEIMPNRVIVDGSAPMDTLTELMDIAAARAAEVLRMAYRINMHLFGMGEPESENKAEPKCFRDVLCEELALLDKTTAELLKLMEKLGC